MTDDILQDIWNRKPEDRPMTRAEIQALLEPRIHKNAHTLTLWIWFYLLLAAATLVLHGINLHGYRTNPVMLALHVAAALLTFGCVGYGVHLMGVLGRMERADESVLATLRRRLQFHATKLEVWFWCITLTTYCLQFALNSWVDNDGGVYRINKPFVFVAVSVAMIAIVYGSLKVAQQPALRELRAMARDLEDEVMDHTKEVAAQQRSWKKWGIVIAIVLLAFMLLGIWAAIVAGK